MLTDNLVWVTVAATERITLGQLVVPVQARVIVPLCGPTESVVASMLTFSVEGVVPADWPSFIQEGSDGVALNDKGETLSLLFTLSA